MNMRRYLEASAVALALAIAAPVAAQYAPAPPGPPPPQQQPQMQLAQPETFKHVARVNLGVGFYNNGWANCYYYYYYYVSCPSGSYTSYVPFLVGPQIDLGVGRGSAIGIGVQAAIGTVTGTYYVGNVANSTSKDVTLWEPTVDYVARFGPPTAQTLGRLRIGGAAYFGPNGGFGGAFRIGGGASFLNTSRLGIGLDVILEAGSYQGYWIGGLQLVVSPELHF
jgi:hypothetical protein